MSSAYAIGRASTSPSRIIFPNIGIITRRVPAYRVVSTVPQCRGKSKPPKLKIPGRSPPLWDDFCPDPFPDCGPQ